MTAILAVGSSAVLGCKVIVYAGKHYGREHTVTAINGRMITAKHLPTGDEITTNICDLETI
ncbi:MAG: hypothetical protein KGL39_43630 [Patescibacteria group bacterium]|nr:hypothetical protein [Patescibacteria group bacterium]